ncbi:MAG: hypothetical protein FJ213_12495 [Ignavibacteria bacterium]|nr:hypothetical protein [Ignavibacteria bacterium]
MHSLSLLTCSPLAERILDLFDCAQSKPSLEGKPVVVGADPKADAYGQPHGRPPQADCSLLI